MFGTITKPRRGVGVGSQAADFAIRHRAVSPILLKKSPTNAVSAHHRCRFHSRLTYRKPHCPLQSRLRRRLRRHLQESNNSSFQLCLAANEQRAKSLGRLRKLALSQNDGQNWAGPARPVVMVRTCGDAEHGPLRLAASVKRLRERRPSGAGGAARGGLASDGSAGTTALHVVALGASI
jgi:hypothetical protein